MKNLSKDKRDRIVLIGIGATMLIALAWYMVISAQNKKLANTRKQIAEQQTKIEGARRLVGSAQTIEGKLSASADKLRQLEADMASGDMYSWVILKVNQFRTNYSVDIPQFSREVKGEVGILPNYPYKAATFTLRGTAFFHDFGKFLAGLENAFPYLRVQNLELEPASGSAATTSDDPEKLAFRMEIVTLINPVR